MTYINVNIYDNVIVFVLKKKQQKLQKPSQFIENPEKYRLKKNKKYFKIPVHNN